MPVNNARVDRSRTNGDPAQFADVAKELLDQRTSQGEGKKVTDTAMASGSGNPKSFLEMAAELRRRR
ncbi:MAG: hypothetical protein OHK0012_14120 [Synechococcales cyanobacterium]